MNRDTSRRLYFPRLGVGIEVVGYLLVLFGMGIWLCAFIASKAEKYKLIQPKGSGPSTQTSAIAGLTLFFAPPPVGFLCVFVGRRLRHPRGEALLNEDKRPPVLYLRSFQIDSAFAKANTWHEQILATQLSEFGPPICIGRPGEFFPPAHFHRMYLSNDEWQFRVRTLLQEACCVVYVQGDSDGLAWELKTITQVLEPRRFLMLIPLARYARLKQLAEKRLPCRLPTSEAIYRGLPPRYDDLAVIMFDDDWQAVALPLDVGKVGLLERLPLVYHLVSRNNPMNLSSTIEPFLARLRNCPNPACPR